MLKFLQSKVKELPTIKKLFCLFCRVLVDSVDCDRMESHAVDSLLYEVDVALLINAVRLFYTHGFTY